MITTDQAIDFLVAAVQGGGNGWSEEQVRAMLEHARPAIAVNPQGFVDLFLDDLAAIKESSIVVGRGP